MIPKIWQSSRPRSPRIKIVEPPSGFQPFLYPCACFYLLLDRKLKSTAVYVIRSPLSKTRISGVVFENLVDLCEHRIQHCFSQSTGEGVLLTRMITADEGPLLCELHRGSVPNLGRRPLRHPSFSAYSSICRQASPPSARITVAGMSENVCPSQ